MTVIGVQLVIDPNSGEPAVGLFLDGEFFVAFDHDHAAQFSLAISRTTRSLALLREAGPPYPTTARRM